MTQKIDSLKVDLQILNRRTEGATYRTIGKELGIACSAVFARWQRLRDEMVFEKVEELREMELMVLEGMQQAVLQAALKGNIRAINSVLSIQVRRAKLCGLDAPIQTQVTITDSSLIDEEVMRLVELIDLKEETRSDE